MRRPRASGLVVAAAALAMLVAEPAAATIVEDDEGDRVTFFRASDEAGIVFHPPIRSVSCGIGALQARTLDAGGSAETARMFVRLLSFRWCRDTVEVLSNGELEVQAAGSRGDGNGTLRSNGLRLTMAPLGFHCIFETRDTAVGMFTGSAGTQSRAKIDLDGAIPRGGGSGVFCGSSAVWTGSYQVVTGRGLNVT